MSINSMQELTFFAVDFTAGDVFPARGEDEEEDEGEDEGDPTYTIDMVGRTLDGQSVCVSVAYHPYFYVDASGWGDAKVRLFIQEAQHKRGASTLCTLLRKKSLFGGALPGATSKPVIVLAFPSLKACKRATAHYKRERLDLAETPHELDRNWPLLRLFHCRDIAPGGWIRAAKAVPVDSLARRSTCELEFQVAPQDLFPVSDLAARPRLRIASWDLETYSSVPGRFPLASDVADVIICVGVALHTYGDPDDDARVLVLTNGPCAPPGEGTHEVRAFTNEAAMLTAFLDLLRAEQVDITLGYNVTGFDWAYLNTRISLLLDEYGEELVDRALFGRLSGRSGGALLQKKMASAAFGTQEETRISMPGVLDLDLLQYARRALKLDSYSLNSVAQTYLGDAKEDLPAAAIFKAFASGGAEGMATIASYCAQDVRLPLRLVAKLGVMAAQFEMASAVSLPTAWLDTRGQQIRCLSVVLRAAREGGFVLWDRDRPPRLPWGAEAPPDEVKGYTGATVLEPVTGAHFGVVSCLDFASLYPSIIRAEKFCFTTLVRRYPEDWAERGLPLRMIDVPGMGPQAFLDPDSLEEEATVVPRLLTRLTKLRKEAKRKMAAAKAAGDAWQATLFDAQQTSFKLVSNSIYGFMGATRGPLPCPAIAASVTTIGRQMLETAAAKALELVPGSQLVYGDTDSVMVRLQLPQADQSDMRAHFALAAKIAEQITRECFRAPHDLEFEKSFSPMLLHSKKKYAALSFEPLPDGSPGPGKLMIKGLQLIRRDTVPYVRTSCQAVLELILARKPDEAWVAGVESMRTLLAGEVAIDQLVMTKRLRSDYKAGDTLPHVIVARRMQQRTGAPMPYGERVRFVWVTQTNREKADLMGALAEDPGWASDRGMTPALLEYAERQLLTPLMLLLGMLGHAAEALLGHTAIAPLLLAAREQRTKDWASNKRQRVMTEQKLQPITKFFAKKQVKEP